MKRGGEDIHNALERLTISGIRNVFTVKRFKGEQVRIAGRQCSGIAVVTSGSYVYTQDGERGCLSDSSHIIFLPKGSVYRLDCYENDIAYVINFNCATPVPKKLLSIPTGCGESLLRDAVKLYNMQNDPVRSHLAELALLYDMLARISEGEANVRHRARKCDISRSVDYIHENYRFPALRIDDIAQRSNISAVYFRRIFETDFGMPPMRYVRNLRIAYARRLLGEREKTVEQIAAECGYTDVFGFSTAFKKDTGYSPTGYVKHLKEI